MTFFVAGVAKGFSGLAGVTKGWGRARLGSAATCRSGRGGSCITGCKTNGIGCPGSGARIPGRAAVSACRVMNAEGGFLIVVFGVAQGG